MLVARRRYSRTKMATQRRRHAFASRLFNRFLAYQARLKYYRQGKKYKGPSRWWQKRTIKDI